MHRIGEHGPEVAERCAQASLATHEVAATRCDDVQAVTWVLEHLVYPPTVKRLQALTKTLADAFGRWALLPWGQLVVLGDVVAAQAVERHHRIVEASRGHAPGADGGTDQIDGLRAARQPVAK